ncbi:MAG: sulfotransferase domain-containing protein [Microcoleaceae cyanobacterium MO_207.B10]|nr:sulfotransferase domain-containing protein [Microcoleaceae cyanobacterium MO_207.B10]
MLKKTIRNITYPVIKAKPNFLIIGAQKAGTTSLYNYLIQHPQIFPRKSFKEVRYYGRAEHYSRGWGWYLSNFPSKIATGNRLNCDASPDYIYYEEVPQLIKKDLGNIKIIAILREPVSRAYSAWQMFHSFANIDNDHLRRFYDPRSFSEAIAEEFSSDFDYRKYPFRYDYVGRGRYTEQLENYYRYFDKDTILILSLNQFKKNLIETLNSVCDFLNIEHFPPEMASNIQQQKYNTGKYKKEEISEEEKKVLERLKDYFQPLNKKLYDLLGHSYDW